MADESEPASLAAGLRWQDRALMWGLALAGLVLALVLVVLFWQPAPPRTVVMSTGPADGAYHAVALKYQAALARQGVTLVLQTSTGAAQNLARLRSGEGDVSVALVQGGLARPADAESLVSLGAMFYEPLWIFHRADLDLHRFGDLDGLRIAAGLEGSGTRLVVEQLLTAFEARMNPPLVALGGMAAARALQHGEVDVAAFISAPDGAAVRQLLGAGGVALMSPDRAGALARQFPMLTRIELPEGAVDLARNIPDADVSLLSLRANLVARRDLHPAVAELLLEAATQVHGGGSVLNRPGAFPSADSGEYPLSGDAERFYKSGSSLLRRTLPYWAVAWIQRLLFLTLPLLAVGVPLAGMLPGFYRWSVRRRIYRWYGELSFIEQAAIGGSSSRLAALRPRFEAIERQISTLRVPLSFAGEAFTLRAHAQMVGRRLSGTELAHE